MGLFLGPTLLAVAYSLLGDWVGNTPRVVAVDAERKDGE
jgi:predicted PurR-regulated permease PerM